MKRKHHSTLEVMADASIPWVRAHYVMWLGVSAAIFLAVLFWRTEDIRATMQSDQITELSLKLSEVKLARKLSDLEKTFVSDETDIAKRLQQIEAARAAVEPTRKAMATSAPFSLEAAAKPVVEIICVDNKNKDTYYIGSGTIIDNTGLIVTNRHVLESDDGTIIKLCGAGLTTNIKRPPPLDYITETIAASADEDLALVHIRERVDKQPLPSSFPSMSLVNAAQASTQLRLGDMVFIAGYPGVGSETFTLTQGIVSGRVGSDYIKTSAFVDSGASGGAAFDGSGQFVGIPTAAAKGEVGGSLGYLIGADVVDKFMADYYAGKIKAAN